MYLLTTYDGQRAVLKSTMKKKIFAYYIVRNTNNKIMMKNKQKIYKVIAGNETAMKMINWGNEVEEDMG